MIRETESGVASPGDLTLSHHIVDGLCHGGQITAKTEDMGLGRLVDPTAWGKV